ncbi:hypothetical protein B0O99DRAFT_628705 [Bisporella sp. PMI_857]|nr:hypothetical protein B0O99DRAFT_628705 [Bisporella sp. PMI_857]
MPRFLCSLICTFWPLTTPLGYAVKFIFGLRSAIRHTTLLELVISPQSKCRGRSLDCALKGTGRWIWQYFPRKPREHEDYHLEKARRGNK